MFPVKFRKIPYLLVAFLFIFLPQSSASAASLGLTLQIKPGNSSESGLENNTRLWFVVPPGGMKTRTVAITNTSSVDEKITLTIGAVKRVNGVSQMAPSETSEIAKWASFSRNEFTLKGKASTEIQLNFTIPVGEDIRSYGAMLLVKASSTLKPKSTQAYSVPGAAQIAAPIFLGVGTEEEFVTSFEIKDIEGVRTLAGNALRVEIKNTGKTPVSINGDIQATGVTFITNTVGPFTYLTETIAPGETKFADAVVGDLINESKWRIFVTATQGSVTETREFEKNISFTGVNPLYTIIFRVLLGLGSLLILAWTISVFKTKKNSGSKQGIRWRRKRNKDLFESSRELIATLEARILEAEARSRAQTRKPKRKVVKKVATRTLKSSKRTTKTTKRKKTAKKVAAKR